MQNQQLVDYIKQQISGGISSDAIRKALLDAGWPAADVDDSMKAAAPAVVQAQTASAAIDPVAAMGGAAAGNSIMAETSSPKTTFFTDAPSEVQPKHSWTRVALGAMAAVIVILLASLVYIYMSLNGKVTAASGENATTVSQASDLRAQLGKISQEKNDLTTQLNTLTDQNKSYAEETGFFAGPLGASVESSITGTVATSTAGYTLTTPHNIILTIKNYKDPRVDGGLKPLIGQLAIVTGTHKVGSIELTVTAINGNAIASAAVASSTKP